MPRTDDIIGATTKEFTLSIRKGSDTDFDVHWLMEDGETLIPIVSTEGYLADKYDADPPILSFADGDGYVTISGGVALVRIPGADTAAMDVLERGVWQFTATSDAGDTKTLLAGPAMIREDV